MKLDTFFAMLPRFLWWKNPDAVAFSVRLDKAQDSCKSAIRVQTRHQRFSG
jgi:hypothetical protein